MLNAVNIEAKQALALNQSITRESSLSQVLQIVFDSLKDAMPQSWVALAADVSEMLVVRLGLVPEAEKLFLSRKDLLERFISLRPQYALTMLRDLGKLNKTTFGPSVNLLVSSLQVDITNSMKLAASKGKTDATAAAAADQAASACAIPKPHKVALLIPGFDALQSPETWSRNWASLLNSKTQEGAYSFLKTFVKNAGSSAHLPEEDNDAEDEDLADGGGEATAAKSAKRKAKNQVPSSMTLSKLGLCGMALVEESADYKSLFSTGVGQLEAGHVSALDIKLLEKQMELLLWDRGSGIGRWGLLGKLDSSAERIKWNFGDADEESKAFSSGNAQQVAKVAKKVQSQRLMLQVKDLKNNEALQRSLEFPFLGSVSTVRTAHSIPLCKVFDVPFFMNAPPNPSPTSPVVIPAWLVGTTNKKDKATLVENQVVCQLATRRCILLTPNNLAVTTAIAESDDELPMVKYIPTKKERSIQAFEETCSGADTPFEFGFPAALTERRTAMEGAGLATSLPTLTKEQKKLEKEKKKALTNAKHLLH
ncbi:unnamed protein product [Durusdinium trenchii]|uniref:Uncharacterized protein n=1 Tax=Durusdinium trenchii TaxID=1381693 RepID=A0ABP0HKB9_9DINO